MQLKSLPVTAAAGDKGVSCAATAAALLEGSLSQWDLNCWQNVFRCHHREGMT